MTLTRSGLVPVNPPLFAEHSPVLDIPVDISGHQFASPCPFLNLPDESPSLRLASSNSSLLLTSSSQSSHPSMLLEQIPQILSLTGACRFSRKQHASHLILSYLRVCKPRSIHFSGCLLAPPASSSASSPGGLTPAGSGTSARHCPTPCHASSRNRKEKGGKGSRHEGWDRFTQHVYLLHVPCITRWETPLLMPRSDLSRQCPKRVSSLSSLLLKPLRFRDSCEESSHRTLAQAISAF